MDDNPYKSPEAPVANSRKPMAAQTGSQMGVGPRRPIGPLQTGIWGVMVAFLTYALVPVSNAFRVGDDSPLDRLRIPHPATIGFLWYFAVCLFAAVCYGLAVGLSHRAVLGLLRHPRAKRVAGWVFLGLTNVGGFNVAMYTYRLPRIRPNRSLHLTRPAAGWDTDVVVDKGRPRK